jgi:uncharacterized protein (TIGR00369 family)
MAETTATPTAMAAEQITEFLAREFPQADGNFTIVSVRPLGAVVRMVAEERHLRPGGTLSGPAMMSLADFAAYVAVLAQIGPVALAVTTNLTINFLRRPRPGALIADCRLIKLGRRLAVAEVRLVTDGDAELVAHAVITYALPPDAGR